MHPVEEPSVYRQAAARCRKIARTSSHPKDWIFMAERWVWLADVANGSWLFPSSAHFSNANEYRWDRSIITVHDRIGERVRCAFGAADFGLSRVSGGPGVSMPRFGRVAATRQTGAARASQAAAKRHSSA